MQPLKTISHPVYIEAQVAHPVWPCDVMPLGKSKPIMRAVIFRPRSVDSVVVPKPQVHLYYDFYMLED